MTTAIGVATRGYLSGIDADALATRGYLGGAIELGSELAVDDVRAFVLASRDEAVPMSLIDEAIATIGSASESVAVLVSSADTDAEVSDWILDEIVGTTTVVDEDGDV